MAKKSTAPDRPVTCRVAIPSSLLDPELSVVLSHVAPSKAAPTSDISDAARILAEQAATRKTKFRDSWEAKARRKTSSIASSRKAFQESQRPARTEKPMREFQISIAHLAY